LATPPSKNKVSEAIVSLAFLLVKSITSEIWYYYHSILSILFT